MPHRELLSPVQRTQVLSLPADIREIVELYTLTRADREFVERHRTGGNRLGMALQLCFLRFPGRAWTWKEFLPVTMLRFIAEQTGAAPTDLAKYARRIERAITPPSVTGPSPKAGGLAYNFQRLEL